MLKRTSIRFSFLRRAQPFLSFFILKVPRKEFLDKTSWISFLNKALQFTFILFTILFKNNMNKNILIFLPLAKNACLWFALWACNENTSLDSHQRFMLTNEQQYYFKSPASKKMKNFPSSSLILCFRDLFLNQLVQQVTGALNHLGKLVQKAERQNLPCSDYRAKPDTTYSIYLWLLRQNSNWN